MRCTYCQATTDTWSVNWEGLKGYPMCNKCHADNNMKNKHFIERQLKGGLNV